jgi:hypothetical protein
MGITAKARAKTALTATTTLEPAAALAVVRTAAENVRGGGKSVLTSGVANLGAMINVEQEQGNHLGMSVTSGKRLLELCTFSATVSSTEGKTLLQVGGLHRYKTRQSKFLYLIPVGPKSILGYDPYRRFLDEVATGLTTRDSAADISIAQPTV